MTMQPNPRGLLSGPGRALLFLIPWLLMGAGCAPPETAKSPSNEDASVISLIAEAGCGQCQLGLSGEGCDLAVRIGGRAFFVDGSSIDDHGDAHGADGLCNCVRQAKITGKIVDGRFQASEFKLLPSGADHP